MDAMQREGAVMAEVRLGTPPRAPQFPRRNRLISGLAHAVVVVEGDVGSGAMITARTAKAQGRQVFAVPGSVRTRSSRGPHRLLAQGARVLAEPEDLLSALGLLQERRKHEVRLSASGAAGRSREKTDPAARILAVLDEYGVHIDTIVALTGLNAAEAARTVSILEMRGLVRALPGKHYVRRMTYGTS
jgi:DNA processing protein